VEKGVMAMDSTANEAPNAVVIPPTAIMVAKKDAVLALPIVVPAAKAVPARVATVRPAGAVLALPTTAQVLAAKVVPARVITVHTAGAALAPPITAQVPAAKAVLARVATVRPAGAAPAPPIAVQVLAAEAVLARVATVQVRVAKAVLAPAVADQRDVVRQVVVREATSLVLTEAMSRTPRIHRWLSFPSRRVAEVSFNRQKLKAADHVSAAFLFLSARVRRVVDGV
jgi:hypothetical protein